MRQMYYGLGVIAVLAFGLLRCWQGSNQSSKQPHEMPSATAETVAQAPEVAQAETKAATDAGSPAAAAEEPLLRRLHALEATNPDLAVTLARQDRERSPNGPDAEERDMVLVAALHNGRDLQAAKNEAWYYFVHYPNGKFTGYLSKLTGIEPPKTPPPQ